MTLGPSMTVMLTRIGIVKVDPSKEALSEARSKIDEQESHIRELELLVAETAEQLVAARKEIALFQNERNLQAQVEKSRSQFSPEAMSELHALRKVDPNQVQDRGENIAQHDEPTEKSDMALTENVREMERTSQPIQDAIERSPAFVERSRELIRAYATERVALERLSAERKRADALEKENALLQRSLTDLSAGSSHPTPDAASAGTSPVDHAAPPKNLVQIKPSASQQRRKDAEIRLESQYTTSGKAVRHSWAMEAEELARRQIAREAWALKLQERASASTTAVHLHNYIASTSPPARSETTLSDGPEGNESAHLRTLSHTSDANLSSEGVSPDDRVPFRRSAYLDARGHRNADGSVGGYRNGRGARLKRPLNAQKDSSEGIEYVPERSRAFSVSR